MAPRSSLPPTEGPTGVPEVEPLQGYNPGDWLARMVDAEIGHHPVAVVGVKHGQGDRAVEVTVEIQTTSQSWRRRIDPARAAFVRVGVKDGREVDVYLVFGRPPIVPVPMRAFPEEFKRWRGRDISHGRAPAVHAAMRAAGRDWRRVAAQFQLWQDRCGDGAGR
jgi:hypothetical protein